MKSTKKFIRPNLFVFFTTFLVFSLFLPVFSFAQTGGLVPDCGANCGWLDLLQLVQNIMNFFVVISIPLAAVAFSWAGFLYLTAGGSEDKVKKAHGIFIKVAIGLFFVLGAWGIVWFISSTLLQGDYILLDPNA